MSGGLEERVQEADYLRRSVEIVQYLGKFKDKKMGFALSGSYKAEGLKITCDVQWPGTPTISGYDIKIKYQGNTVLELDKNWETGLRVRTYEPGDWEEVFDVFHLVASEEKNTRGT